MALSRTASSVEDGSSFGSTVIAIDRDRNSRHAVKWAVDHLLKKNSCCTLIHVRTKSLHPQDIDAAAKDGRPPTAEELDLFFLPFRGFCARNGIIAKELILHDIDVPSALIDYIIDNSISNIVVGASNRNALTRKFKDADVPTCLVRSVPEFCTVHVISKGKVQNIRPDHSHKPLPDTQNSDHINRKLFNRGSWQSSGLDRASFGRNNSPMKVAALKSNTEAHTPTPSTERSSSQNSSNQNPLSFTSVISGRPSSQLNMLHDNQDVSMNSDSSEGSPSSKTPKGLEIEIMKLKLQLKKTMEKYNLTCREVIEARQKVLELEQSREEEERNLEKARLAEEAALALAEVEREKTTATVESLQMSKRLTEMEAQKRKHAEMKAMREEEDRKRAVNALADNTIHCRRYSIKEIEVATHNFDDFLKIGEGGYGPVYRGVLDHTAVAIKVLRPDLAHGERQFQQEVEVLSSIRHPNMVLLLGTCPEYGCIVYEYMENGSLEDRLFQKDNTPPIPWKLRFKIAAEIATGLLFLHQTKPEPLVHRDLKPANILLDRNCVSKISDVGLARLVPPNTSEKTTQYHVTAAAGTFCYIDPEYQQTGLLGVKSDIYSLGVMLLQIITGKPPMGLSHLVDKAIRKGKFSELLDPSVTDWPVEEALSCAKLALKCCELRKRDRPDLGSVILPELNRLKDLGGDDSDSLPASQEGMSKYPNLEMENSTYIHVRKRWQPFKLPDNSVWNLRSFCGKTGLLPPAGKHIAKSTKNDAHHGCWSFVGCSDASPSLKKFHSFS